MNVASQHDEKRLDELLQAVACQNRPAFEEFYDATTEQVLSIVLRITQSIELAEEVVSDVFLQVWRDADRFDPTRGNAQAWLTVMSRSRALDAMRKNSKEPTNGAAPISEVEEPGTADFSQDLLLATETNTAIHTALDQLKPDQRQLLALAFFRGYSHNELAQFTGIPLGTIKSTLRRTLSQLKDLVIAAEHPQDGST